MSQTPSDNYSAKETERRAKAAIAKMLATPPAPRTKKKPSPAKRKAKKRT